MRVMWLGLVLAGCPQTDDPDYTGFRMEGFFPFDGVRTWEFVNVDDDTVPYKLVATLAAETEDRDGYRIYDVEYDRVCLGDDETCEDGWDKTLRMSADSKGARIHEYSDADTVDVFDPPLAIANGRMIVGETAEVDSLGGTWTTEFTALVESCPILWAEWDGCAELTTTSDLDHPLVGTVWVQTGWNIVAWRAADGDQWQLLRATYQDVD